MDPIDAEFQELVEDYEAERNLARIYPTNFPSSPGTELTVEEQELYDAIFGEVSL